MTPQPPIDLISIVAAWIAIWFGERFAPLLAPYIVIAVVSLFCAAIALNSSSVERTGGQSKWFVFTAVSVAFLFTVAIAHLLSGAADRWFQWHVTDSVLLPIVAGLIAGTREHWSDGFKWAWSAITSFFGRFTNRGESK